MRTFAATAVCVAAAATLATIAVAHELTETSATMIVRDGGHVHLRLQVPFDEVLRREIMPGERSDEFGRVAAAMPDAEFARAFARVRAKMTAETMLLVNRRPVALTNWAGPSAAEAQQGIRAALMARLVDPQAHSHATRLTVTADARASANPETLQIRLPVIFGPYLVTAYRPSEAWVRGGALSPEVKLSAPTSSRSAQNRP